MALIAPLRGSLVFALMLLNITFWGLVFFLTALVLLIPVRGRGPWTRRRLQTIVEAWSKGNQWIFRFLLNARWEIDGTDDIRPDENYLVIANHQSWLDIPAVHKALVDRTSFIKFFLKRQLLYVPIVGLACWLLDFPFMKRYSKEFLAENPEKRGEDLASTRHALRFFGKVPVSILNFMEGTRFTKEKRISTGSEYNHLLHPRSGGVAFVLGAVGDKLHGILDLTIAYPPHDGDIFWNFLCGRISSVWIHVERRPIPVEYITDSTWNEPETREEFRAWIREIWREKDQRIEERRGRC